MYFVKIKIIKIHKPVNVFSVYCNVFVGFDKEDYKKRLYETFGAESDYEVKLSHPGLPVKSDYPINGPWRNGSIREFLKNYADGKEITGKQNDAQVRSDIITWKLACYIKGEVNPI